MLAVVPVAKQRYQYYVGLVDLQIVAVMAVMVAMPSPFRVLAAALHAMYESSVRTKDRTIIEVAVGGGTRRPATRRGVPTSSERTARAESRQSKEQGPYHRP